MKDKIIIDIEIYLELMEQVCLKYRRIDYNNLIFINGIRLPLEVRCEAGKYPTEFISNKPFHPIVAAGLAKEIILSSYVRDDIRKLMLTNPLVPDYVPDKYIPESKTLDGVISDFLGDVDDEDVEELIKISDQMLNYLSKFNIPNDRVLDIDIEKNFIVINIGENIAILRMREAGYI